MNWSDQANCRGTGPETSDDVVVWFADEGTQDAADAIAICAGCPVWGDCLAYAVTRDVVGVWGGTTATQRATMRRRGRVPIVERVGARVDLKPHGTEAAIRRHHRAGEPLCDRCARAKEFLDAERRGSRRVA